MKPFLQHLSRRERGLALIIVVSSLALISMLIIAIFSLTRREFKATQGYVSGKTAKQLGDAGTAIVMAQIQNGQATAIIGANATTHATQPGMVRVYSPDGSFRAAHKLYSSATMSVLGGAEDALHGAAHVAPANWHDQPARFVDLNEPVVRPNALATATADSAGYAVYFPIIDPRAAHDFRGGASGADGPGSSVPEGFSYQETTDGSGGGSSVSYAARVVTDAEAGSNTQQMRLPMPVEWLYVLQDGTIGALAADNTFVTPAGGTDPSPNNPIIGRIAFWTDDESCKININTAGEPTFTSTPFFYHQRDMKWAHFPPATGEYQRYPGHPATVALSSVLAPNFMLDPYFPSRDGGGLSRQNIVQLKNKIYDLMPKLASGGSDAGTRPFVTDDFSNSNVRDSESEPEASKSVNLNEALSERLYASVDELLFTDRGFGASGRTPARFAMPGRADQFLLDHDTIERSRFFLTANSRSPETTIHGLPRVCIWPVADESLGSGANNQFRTSFDNMIALTGRIGAGIQGSGTYFFRRARGYSPTYDLGGTTTLERNDSLLKYLVHQMSDITWPATSPNAGAAAANFEAKYGSDNVSQMALQFFDYIRSTNLYDGMLARKNGGWNERGNGNRYTTRDSLRNGDTYTFTAPRISEPARSVDNVTAELDVNGTNSRSSQREVYPGHGQVSPPIWNNNGNTYKGFGRMFTISEIGFQFICTADGAPVEDGAAGLASLTTFRDSPVPAQSHGRGGGTSPRWSVNDQGQGINNQATYQGFNVDGGDARWYSNFPPVIEGREAELFPIYGCDASRPDTDGGNPFHPSRHPGFLPSNWNYTLEPNKPLRENEKRVQAMFLLETFCPSVGWTSFYPEFTIVMDLDRLANIKVRDIDGNQIPIVNGTGKAILKSGGNIYDSGTNRAHPLGGHASPTRVAGGRRLGSMLSGNLQMPEDPGYDTNNTGLHEALSNFQFVSLPFTVDRNAPLQLEFPNEDITIDIYDTHDYQNAEPVQTLQVNFGNMGLETTLPVPHLVGVPFTYPNSGQVVQTGPRRYGRAGATADMADRGQYHNTVDSNGRRVHYRTMPGPHWWGFNWGGSMGRTRLPDPTVRKAFPDGPFWSVSPQLAPSNEINNSPEGRTLRGRLDTDGSGGWDLPEFDRWASVPLIPDDVSDVIRSIVPTAGDYRVLAALRNVPASYWRPHPFWKPDWTSVRQAHSFSGHNADSDAGAIFAMQPTSEEVAMQPPAENKQFSAEMQLVGGALYQLDLRGNYNNTNLSGRHADLPPYEDWAQAANAFGDFDTGLTSCREGPYINKPDEGNFYAGWDRRDDQLKFERSGYFRETFEHAEDWRSGIYMTPNRLISSPVFFGSLPTGVWPGGSVGSESASRAGTDYAPWQTLLFRPHAQVTNAQPSGASAHPGAQDPSDHHLLDMFYMPVVEPYAISEPLSIAGRVNMNYQIMPFTHIRRATALHAVMKGEFITAIPNNRITEAKNYRLRNGGSAWNDTFNNDTEDNAFWHRPMDVRATLRQFDLRFQHRGGGAANANGLFRSASQICDIHLIPEDRPGAGTYDVGAQNLRNASSLSDFESKMNEFWGNNRPTGDNVRERPYSNLYARLTTRSNTFRVHLRTQVIRKARSSPSNSFDPVKDAIVSEYRGSSLIERFIDPNDAATIPDYGAGFSASTPPLDAFYRFRVLETKRFAP